MWSDKRLSREREKKERGVPRQGWSRPAKVEPCSFICVIFIEGLTFPGFTRLKCAIELFLTEVARDKMRGAQRDRVRADRDACESCLLSRPLVRPHSPR